MNSWTFKMNKLNKMNKMNKMNLEQSANAGGFTVMEVIVSWMLVLLALLFVGDIIIFSLNGTGMSRTRMEMDQELESYKNELAGKPFNAKEFEDGFFSTSKGPFKINRQITRLSPTLKKITLTITYKSLSKKTYFYKSKYIEEVYHD